MHNLHAHVRRLLARMSVLTDAKGVSFIPSGHGGKHQSTGTTGPGRRDADQDLFTKWAARFADPANADRLATLVLLAERELASRTSRKPTQIGEGPDGRESSWERDSRIVEWYEGIPAGEAAIYESQCGTVCDAQNIRAVRRRNDCDPEHGFAQVPREQRQRVARELAARGWSTRRIAREMNVSQSTVIRCLGHDEREAAA